MAFLQRIRPHFTRDEREAADSPGADLIGEALRWQREALGLDLWQIAEALKIKVAYLVALEAGRPEQLPGSVYALGFLRAYANYLGFDTDEILCRFKQNPAAFRRKPDLTFPMQLGGRSIPGAGMLLVAAILAICGYGTWFYLSTAKQSRPQRVAEVPAELLPASAGAPATHPTEAWAATPAAPETSEAISEPTASSAAPAFSSSSAAAGAAEAATQTAALAPASPPRDASAAPGTPVRIVLHAIADSWVEIRDAGRTMLLARLLKAGEIYGVPDRPGLSMRTGNAGGLAITVDGDPAPSIGPMGAVRRNVVLEPEALAAGAAVRP